VPGLNLHIRNAIRYGTTREEVMEMLEILSVIGIHAVTVAAPTIEVTSPGHVSRPVPAGGSAGQGREEL
jgi:hypothetical protein